MTDLQRPEIGLLDYEHKVLPQLATLAMTCVLGLSSQ